MKMLNSKLQKDINASRSYGWIKAQEMKEYKIEIN
jgi:hypothetical protein